MRNIMALMNPLEVTTRHERGAVREAAAAARRCPRGPGGGEKPPEGHILSTFGKIWLIETATKPPIVEVETGAALRPQR